MEPASSLAMPIDNVSDTATANTGYLTERLTVVTITIIRQEICLMYIKYKSICLMYIKIEQHALNKAEIYPHIHE